MGMEEQMAFDFSGAGGENPAKGASLPAADSRASETRCVVGGFDVEQLIAEEWSLPLGETIELVSRNPETLHRGRLELAEIPHDIDRRKPLQLRIRDQKFSSREIVSWRLD